LFCMRKGLVNRDAADRRGIVAEIENINIDFVFNPAIGEYETYLNSENVEREIRSMEVTSYVSLVSQVPEIRTRMVELQRQMGISKGIVMDGRD
ncbi:MAG TPA: (d)CMP kinase, partial [Bacteroidales bacterium]|nr:(d)CMP kinase [Bacteroidales bacterium]